MDTMILAWVLGVPLALMLIVLGLERLESMVVAPIDRADRIARMIDLAAPEEIEQKVSVLLAPVASTEGGSRLAQS